MAGAAPPRSTSSIRKAAGQAALTYTGTHFIDHLATLPLHFQPGSTWDYGFGLDVLGLVVEQITEQTLGAYLQDNVFKPLGMVDTTFLIPADKAGRYAKPLPVDPVTGRPQALTPADPAGEVRMRRRLRGLDRERLHALRADAAQQGQATATPASSSRKTVEYMLSNQIGPEVKNLIGNADPTRADYGFGLGLAVQTTPGIVRMAGSVGNFSWPGASGTNWWADPKEDMVVVFMAHTPGTDPLALSPGDRRHGQSRHRGLRGLFAHGHQAGRSGAVAPHARRLVHRHGVAGPDHRGAVAGAHPGGAGELRARRAHRLAHPSARPDPARRARHSAACRPGAARSAKSAPATRCGFRPARSTGTAPPRPRAMAHIAMQEALDGVAVTWMEHVTDAQYEGKSG